MNWRGRGGRIIDHVKHLSSCACPLCDPEQTKVKAARAKFLVEQAARRAAEAAGVMPPPPARVVVRLPRPDDDRTRRFRELLRDGVPAARALEAVEMEFTKPKGDST